MNEKEEDRIGNWGQSFSGIKFWPLDPRPEEINIIDIAHALSLVCRYNGHSRFHYSVAQHSVLVASVVPRELRLEALMHDASEAYVCDIPRTFKAQLTGYKQIEDKMMNVIATKYGFTLPLSDEVKEADKRMLVTEKKIVMAKGPCWEMEKTYEPYRNVIIDSISPLQAEKLFLETFLNIVGTAAADAFEDSLKKVIPHE